MNSIYKRELREYYVTYTLILINIVVFALMTLVGGSTNYKILIIFGAKVNELIDAGHKYMLPLITKNNLLLAITEQNENVVVNTVILTKIEVKAVSENLRPSIGKKVLRHQNNQRMFFLSTTSEILVRLSVGR